MAESIDSTVSAVPEIDPDEQAQLDSGELVEKYISFRFSSVELSNMQRRAEIENGNDNERGVAGLIADIAIPGTDIYNEILAPLEWWGYYNNI